MTEKIINGQDITQFILQEKKKPNSSDIPHAFNLFTGLLSKSIHDMYLKIKQIENIEMEHIIKTGSDLLWHVFWIVYAFSFNIKLTVFLSERCILLFTEFIIMSRNPILSGDLNYIPNVNDAMQFSLKKTIENLKLPLIDSIKIQQNIELYRTISFDIKYLYQNIFNKLMNFHVFVKKQQQMQFIEINTNGNDNITFDFVENEFIEDNKDIYVFLDTINMHIGKLICNIHKLEHTNDYFVYNLIKHIFHDKKCKHYSLKSRICLMKITLELYIELNLNYNCTQDIFNKLLDKIIEHLDDFDTVNINNLQNIKKRKIFKKLQNYIHELCS